MPGALDVLILRTLVLGEQHGQGIARAVQQTSDDALLVDHGSLYPALGLGARRALATQLFGVAPLEPAVGAVVVMTAVVLGATLLPSVAAASVSPTTPLKDG